MKYQQVGVLACELVAIVRGRTIDYVNFVTKFR